MISLFLGAGFSKWAANLPLVHELFDFEVSTTSAERNRIELLRKDWENWRERNVSDSPEQFIYWCLNDLSHRKSRVLWYINKRLSEPFMTKILGGYSSIMFDQSALLSEPVFCKVREFLRFFIGAPFSGIVTCNYDTLIECALGTSGFNYGMKGEVLSGRGKNPAFPWQGANVSVSGDVSLAKLHGSLSWDQNSTKYTSGLPGRKGKSLLVPPAPEKTPPPELSNVWRLGAEVIKKSDLLVVFGFAFNPYDEALLHFLQEEGSHLSKVLLIDPYPNLDAARELWSSHTDLDTIDPIRETNLVSAIRKHAWFARGAFGTQ